MMILRQWLSWAVLAVLITACRGAEAKPAIAGAVDSAVPRDAAIAHFQRSLAPVSGFQGGASSRDSLVRRFVTALEKRDTAGLRALVLNRSEFGRLYYPTNPEGMPPYNLTPQLQWFMVDGQSDRGYQKLLQRRAGRPFHYLGYRCESEPSIQSENTVWGACVVLRESQRGDTIWERLFGQIVERGGQYKFLSYANKL